MNLDQAEIAIVVLNVILGLGCAFPLARRLGRLSSAAPRIVFLYVILVAVYFVECVAFAAGMATNIPGIALAFVWGIALGFWLRRLRQSLNVIVTTALLFSLYTSLPSLSFLSVPVMMVMGGRPIVTVEGGVQFGIPEFVPWPASTILGFCIFVALAGTLFKTMITTGASVLVVRLGKGSSRRGIGRLSAAREERNAF
jgi:hypothetical protein